MVWRIPAERPVEIGEASHDDPVYGAQRAHRAGHRSWRSLGQTSLQCALIAEHQQDPLLPGNLGQPLTHWIARRLVEVEWIGMPNIILDRAVFPELIQSEVTPEALAEAVRTVRTRRAEMSDALEQLRARLGAPGAAERAADLALGLVR